MRETKYHRADPVGQGTGQESVEATDGQACLLESSPAAARRTALLRALERCRRVVAQKPGSAWAWHGYGEALQQLNRPAEALPALRKAVELAPDTVLFRYHLGLALQQLDQAQAASEQFAGIVERDPRLECAWSNLMLGAMTHLALNQERLGAREQAIETLLPALDTVVPVLFNLGYLHFRARRFEAALPFAQAAWLLRPNHKDVLHQYGAILSELKRLRPAVAILRQATALDPDCAAAWHDLGLAHARLKQRPRARRCLERSLQLDPGRPWTHYDLACLDALEAQRDKAFQRLRQAVRCGFRDLDHLRRDSDLRSLRRDARWTHLLNTLRARQYADN
jgi:tetratricopeptide (TPR) repeat protein